MSGSSHPNCAIYETLIELDAKFTCPFIEYLLLAAPINVIKHNCVIRGEGIFEIGHRRVASVH